jgi:DNA-binding response OmpR family regulator
MFISAPHKTKTTQSGTTSMTLPNRKRILLVEDYEDSRDLAALTLAEYTPTCARNFNEGLRLARHGYFDLYILDNWLPDGSGVELCRSIRGFDPHTPILFHSAAAYAKDIQQGLQAGAQAYLVKPVLPDELRRTVAQLISAPRETAFEARRAELAAIREEMAIPQTKSAELREKSRKLHQRSVRVRALAAFLAAGGTRGGFAREWLSGVLEEVCDASTPAAVSDD